jgi:hypothetical protein
MSGNQNHPIRTPAQFAVGRPPGRGYIGPQDPLPGKPDISGWTPPTYYTRGYLARFGGFAFDLDKPLIIEERHYDPVTHALIDTVPLVLHSPDVIKRPPGTYISIRFAQQNAVDNPDIQLVDLDVDKDEDV